MPLVLVLKPQTSSAQTASPQQPCTARASFKSGEAGLFPVTALPAFLLRTFQFADSAGGWRVEVRLGLVNDILQFRKIDTTCYSAAYEVNLAIFDAHQTCWASRSWQRQIVVTDFAATNDRAQFNLDAAAFRLPAGQFQLEVEIVDRQTHRRMRRQYPLALPELQAGKLQLSSPLVREERDRAAQVLNEVSDLSAHFHRPPQYLYLEVYGAEPGADMRAAYAITHTPSDTIASWSTSLVAKGRRLSIDERLENRIPRSGAYQIHVLIKCGKQEIGAQADFKVLPTLAGTQIDAFNLPRDLRLGPLQYVSAAGEYERLRSASGLACDSLLAVFWQQRDPTPGTAANELQSEFYRRVALAEAAYEDEGETIRGWQTDRGRIFIIYGAPQEVHIRNLDQNELTYEIWLYPELGRRFIFRERMDGRFALTNR